MTEPNDSSLSVADLVGCGVEVRWPEAVALVRAVAAVMPPGGDVEQCRLSADGSVSAGESLFAADRFSTLPLHALAGETDVTALARLLDKLLPPPGSGADRPPAALRYTLMRALGSVAAPPFPSVEQFSLTLARFEHAEPAAQLAALFARSSPLLSRRSAPQLSQEPRLVREESPRLPQEESHRLRQHAPQPDLPQPAIRPEWDRWTTDAVPAAEPPLAAPTMDAVAEHEAELAATSLEPGDRLLLRAPVPVVEPRLMAHTLNRPRRRPAGALLTALTIVSILLALGVVAAAVVLSDPARRAQVLHASGIGRPSVDAALNRLAGLWGAVASKQATGQRPGQANANDSASVTRAQGTTASGGRMLPDGDSAATGSASALRTGDGKPAATVAGAIGTRGSHTDPNSGQQADQQLARASLPSPLDAASAPPLVPRPGDFVAGLDEGRRPVFTPAFATGGTALFAQSSSVRRDEQATREGADGANALHLLSVVTEDARNFHPQLSPDGAMVAFDSDRGGTRGVYVSDRDGGNVRRVSGDGYAAFPKWSPDGRALSFVKAEEANPGVWNIWTVNIFAGSLERLTSNPTGQPWGASWLPDGRRICYALEDRIIVLDTRSGETRLYPSPRKGVPVRTPVVSPDGRRALFQVQGAGGWLLDLEDGSTRQVIDDPSAEEFAWAPDGSRAAYFSRQKGQWGVWIG